MDHTIVDSTVRASLSEAHPIVPQFAEGCKDPWVAAPDYSSLQTPTSNNMVGTIGLPWCIPKPSIMMTMDASLKAWGAHLLGMMVQYRWSQHQKTPDQCSKVASHAKRAKKGLHAKRAILFKLKGRNRQS